MILGKFGFQSWRNGGHLGFYTPTHLAQMIVRDFMHFYSGNVREPSLKKSAFCIFFQAPSVSA